jgi:hypothetical protein
MGRKNLLSPELFKTEIEDRLLKLGFRIYPYYSSEFDQARNRLGLIPPKGRKKQGRETGFRFDANGYTLIVWPSYVKSLGRCRDNDQVHILILEGDEILYKTHEIRRTTNFVRRLLCYAWINRWKVLNRPTCPHCNGAHMHLNNKPFRQYWWSCGNVMNHPNNKWFTLGWDSGLEDKPKAMAFLDEMRLPGQKYRNKLKKDGKELWTRTRKHIGRGWRITKTKNMNLRTRSQMLPHAA